VVKNTQNDMKKILMLKIISGKKMEISPGFVYFSCHGSYYMMIV
jgi:hypothetical protein